MNTTPIEEQTTDDSGHGDPPPKTTQKSPGDPETQPTAPTE